jgi:hypothetical protein
MIFLLLPSWLSAASFVTVTPQYFEDTLVETIIVIVASVVWLILVLGTFLRQFCRNSRGHAFTNSGALYEPLIR